LENELTSRQEPYRVRLEIFEGPLDLLLHLIRKNEVDIYDIPIALIVDQYTAYLDMLNFLNLDVAGEFLVMAATLSHIKSRMLLPAEEGEGEEEAEDPRMELVRRLLEYQRYKEAAEELMSFEQLGRDVYTREPEDEEVQRAAMDSGRDMVHFQEVGIFQLLDAFKQVLARARVTDWHEISMDRVSITEKISQIMEKIRERESIAFEELFTGEDNKADLIVSFLAVLELLRLRILRAHQPDAFGPILIFRAVSISEDMLKRDYITGMVQEI
jgi:segregation and condensation protein A